MQEMLGMEKNKKLLFMVVVGSIIIALLGMYIFLFTNPKQVFLGIVDDINNRGIEIININMEPISLYNNSFITNADVDYYIQKEAQRTEETIVIDKKTKEESIVYNTVPYTQVWSNKFNVYANRSKSNSHDVIRLTLPNGEESTVYNVYYQNGTLMLDAPEYDQFIKLNDSVLKFGNAKPSTLNKILTMYNRVYEQIKKQFKDSDFYKVSIEDNSGSGQTLHKFGLSITQERMNQIAEKVLQLLSKDQEFINAYISYQKDIDINSSIDKSAVRELINSWLDKIQQQNQDEGKAYEVVITTSGAFNENIKQIEIFELQYDNVLKSINIEINENSIQLDIQDNAVTILNVNANILENGIQMNITNEKMHINATLNDFVTSKEISLAGTFSGNRIVGKYIMKRSSDDTVLNNEIDVKVNDGNIDIMYVKVKNKTEFKNVNEYVNSKKIYGIEQLDVQVKEYFDKFNREVIEKLGINMF